MFEIGFLLEHTQCSHGAGGVRAFLQPTLLSPKKRRTREAAEGANIGQYRLWLVLPYRVVSALSATRNARMLVAAVGTKSRSTTKTRTQWPSATWVTGAHCFASVTTDFRLWCFPYA